MGDRKMQYQPVYKRDFISEVVFQEHIYKRSFKKMKKKHVHRMIIDILSVQSDKQKRRPDIVALENMLLWNIKR